MKKTTAVINPFENLPAPDPAPDPADLIREVLGRHQCPPSAELLRDLDEMVDEIAFCRAAEFARHLLRQLEGSSAAVALERVILGEDGELQTEAARRAGVSRPALGRLEGRIRRRINGEGTECPKSV